MRNIFLKIVVFGLALVAFPIVADAQSVGDFSPEWYKFESGQGPITGGVALTTRWARTDGRFVELSAQSEAGWIVYGQYLEKGDFTLSLGATIGHQQDAFWWGPYADLFY